jgi:hypothetical protein
MLDDRSELPRSQAIITEVFWNVATLAQVRVDLARSHAGSLRVLRHDLRRTGWLDRDVMTCDGDHHALV